MIVVTTVNDKPRYTDQLAAMLQSTKVNSPDTRVVVYIVSCSEKTMSDFKSMFPDVVFRHGDGPTGDIKGFMVCYRTTLVRSMLEEFRMPVLWSDVDVIVRKGLAPLASGLPDNGLKILVRPNQKEACRFQAGVFVVGCSPATLKLARDWEEIVRKENEWWSDQRWLSMLCATRQDVEVVPMTYEEHSVSTADNKEVFLPEAAIWHCKRTHFKNPRYQEEYRKYLQEAYDSLH